MDANQYQILLPIKAGESLSADLAAGSSVDKTLTAVYNSKDSYTCVLIDQATYKPAPNVTFVKLSGSKVRVQTVDGNVSSQVLWLMTFGY